MSSSSRSEQDIDAPISSQQPTDSAGGSASHNEEVKEEEDHNGNGHLTGQGLDRVLSKDMVAQERDAAPSPRVRQHEPPKFDVHGFQLGESRGSGLKVRPGMPGKWWDDQVATVSGVVRPRDVPPQYNNDQNAPIDPSSWRQEPKHPSRTALLDARRREWRVDPSFDLDGDGQVSQLDYFFARQFDRDRDGKLNADEKAAALEALRHGYADNFVEIKAPAQFPAHRVVQRRGAVIAEERGSGWAELQRTFPPEAFGGASGAAPFYVTEQDGPAAAADQDEDAGRGEYRHLGYSLDIHSRRDLMRARRVENSRSMRKKYARKVFRGGAPAGEESSDDGGGGGEGDETLSVASSVDDRVKPTTGTLDGIGASNTSHRGLLHMRKMQARREAARALGMSDLDCRGPPPGVAPVTAVATTTTTTTMGCSPVSGRAQTAGSSPSTQQRGARTEDEEDRGTRGDRWLADMDDAADGSRRPERAQTAAPGSRSSAPRRSSNGEGVASLLRTVGVGGTGVQAAFDDDNEGIENGAAGPLYVRDPLRARARTSPDQLSHTQAELRGRRRATQAAHGHDVAPRTGLGIHSEPVPCLEETLSGLGKTWFEQQPPVTKVPTPWDRGSVLDHPRVGSPGGGFGRVESHCGRRVDATTGKPLIRSGLTGPRDPPACLEETKRRTTSLRDLPQVRKRTTRDIPVTPVQMDPWQVLRHHERPDTVGPPGIRHVTRRWTDDIIAYRQAMEEDDDNRTSVRVPKYQDPSETAPLYSSFTTDHVFRDTWNEKRVAGFRPERSRWSSMSGHGSEAAADATGVVVAGRQDSMPPEEAPNRAMSGDRRTPAPSPLRHQPRKKKRRRRSIYGTPIVMKGEGKDGPRRWKSSGMEWMTKKHSSADRGKAGIAGTPQPRQRRNAPQSSVHLSQGSGLFHGVKGARNAERLRASRSKALLERCELEQGAEQPRSVMTPSNSLPAIPLRSPLWSRIQPLESE